MTATARPAPDAPDAATPAGLLRRLAALLYDALLLGALLMIATACFLPFTGGEAVTWQRTPALAVLHRIVLLGVVIGFFGLFWTRQGHTLGMASWRLRVRRLDGARLTWRDSVLRLAAAVLSWLPFGLGWFWSLVDPAGRTWHDRLSRTEVVVLPKPPRKRPGGDAGAS